MTRPLTLLWAAQPRALDDFLISWATASRFTHVGSVWDGMVFEQLRGGWRVSPLSAYPRGYVLAEVSGPPVRSATEIVSALVRRGEDATPYDYGEALAAGVEDVTGYRIPGLGSRRRETCVEQWRTDWLGLGEYRTPDDVFRSPLVRVVEARL